jgi:hypothetical protein
MTSQRLVVAQTKAHLIGFFGLAAVLTAAGLLVVQRPLREGYPIGLLIAAIFAIAGLTIFTSRLVLDGQTLSQRRYWRELWRVNLSEARFGEETDGAGWTVLRVESNGRRIGRIRAIYFDQNSLHHLLERIAEIQEHMPD